MTVRTVLIDLSGTLHIENTATPNAVAALQRLRDAALNIKFVTNTTKESRRCLYERLIGLGFQVSQHEIFTSLNAARSLVEKEGFRKPMLLLETAALEDFQGISQPDQGEKADAVVIGLSPSQFNYPVLNTAFRNILSGASLIAIHQARYFKEKDGLSLGPGPFVRGLEYACDCKATVVGKPEPAFFRAALDDADPSTAVMIGDDVRDDIAGAQSLGMKGFLVQTGKYRHEDETKINPPPYATCPDFSHVVDKILAM